MSAMHLNTTTDSGLHPCANAETAPRERWGGSGVLAPRKPHPWQATEGSSHSSHPSPLGGPAASLTDAVASQLEIGAVVAEIDTDVRDAMAVVAGLMRGGGIGTDCVAGMLAHAERNVVALAPQWGVGPIDRQFHAIDVDADHPHAVFIAGCGHTLRRGTALYAEPSDWRTCPDCVRWTTR